MIKSSELNLFRSFYNRNGYVVIKNFLDTEKKKKLIQYVNDVESDTTINKYLNQYEYCKNNNKVLCRTEYIIDNHSGFKNIITKGKIPEIVSKINNSPVHIYKEKINYKYPNTGGYRAHQDITAYPNSKNNITCMINLCNTNLKNGCLEFSPMKNKFIIENNNGIILNPEKLEWINCPTNFGDIVLFNSYIPHRSGPNLLNIPRKAIYLTYNNIEEGYLRDEYYKNKKENLCDGKISLIDHYDGNISNNNDNDIINEIVNLYKEKGHKKYDFHITHLEHALQTTELAKINNESEEFQLACFLHDIGHLILDEHNTNIHFLDKDLKHETIGYRYLSKYFSDNITQPIMHHVLAKRYLCTIDYTYYNNLSEASKKSFIIQGGKINDHFTNILKNNKKFIDAVKMRKYEDQSKNEDINISIDLNYIRLLLDKFIISSSN